ncbi:OmpH family outer membrane protein [Paracoccus albus]|uniref:OmpH family outer membrane protein n=1 Tax=Paracoccus albus TaxID=3017784 RepID=UPI0022F048E7|nr:OmpH family outer membrane protein [Paracoccus albus]WBU59101.1 OmpH family outer membrane protein [Paracoccus albus]
MSFRLLVGRIALCVALACLPQAGAAQQDEPAGEAQAAPPPAANEATGPDQFLGASPAMQLPAQTAVLILDVEQAYLASEWGQRAQSDIEAAAREIEAENTRMEEQLVSEERALAAERETLSPAEFREKAEVFDLRAQEVRRERRQAAVDLGTRAQADRTAFVDAALPVIAAIMQDRSAGVVLDRRQVMAATNAVDITQQLIERMDRDVGDGGQLPDVPIAQENPPADGVVPPAPIDPGRASMPPPLLDQQAQPQQ